MPKWLRCELAFFRFQSLEDHVFRFYCLERPERPEPSLSRLKAFDAALCALDDFEAYKRGEKDLTYYIVTDDGYGQALSLPVATKEEAIKALELILPDHPGASVVSNIFLA